MGADGGLGPCGHRTRTLQRQASLSPFPRFPSAVSDAQMPQGVRADLSAAYRAMLEALLPRFGALRGAAGPAPDSTSARMLTGFKRALRQRGIAIKPQQGIEPEYPPRVQLQPSQFTCQCLGLPGVQAIGDDQNHGAPPHQFARMVHAQAFQRRRRKGRRVRRR